MNGIDLMTERAVTATRVQQIKPSPSTAAAARVKQLKAEGRSIIDLTVGEPDFDTPPHIKAAAIAAIDAGDTKYTPVNGTPELRRAILARTERKTAIAYSDSEVTVGGGGKQVIFLAMMATLDPGDQVIIPAPYWVSYPDIVVVNGGVPVIVPTQEAAGLKLTPSDLASVISDKSRWLILNTPGNPTGAVYSADELAAIAQVLRQYPHLNVLTDEIYDEISFEGSAPSLVEVAPDLKERIVVVNGVSKAFAMTGWRLGYATGPAEIIAAINKLQSQSSSCPSSISQAAATAALDGPTDFIETSLASYRERRDAAVRLLNAVDGITCRVPEGAFYAFANCAGLIGARRPDGRVLKTDEDVTMFLLEDAGVAVIQGSAYGFSPYFRISFATSMEQIEAGGRAIAAAVETLTR